MKATAVGTDTLRLKAVGLYLDKVTKQQEEDAELARQDALRRLERFRESLRWVLEVDILPFGLQVTVDELTFRPSQHSGKSVDLLRACDNCGGEVTVAISSLTMLGQILVGKNNNGEDWVPECGECYEHRTSGTWPASDPAPSYITPLEELGQAFLNFIAANGYGYKGEE